MKEKLRRYGKQFMVYICTFVIVAGSVFSFSFESKASDRVYYMPINEPAKTDSQGYILLELKDVDTGQYYARCFFWDIVVGPYSNNDTTSYMNIIVEDGSIVFFPCCSPSGASYQSFISGTFGEQCILYSYMSGYSGKGDFYSYYFDSQSNLIITGCSYYGNVNNLDIDISTNNPPNVVWADDKTLVDEIINIKNQLIALDSSYGAQCNNIIAKLGYTNECLDELIVLQNLMLDKQDETNSWLEKIWNSIQEFFGSKGEESTEQLPDEEISSTLESEEALLQDTTDAENNLSFSIDSNSNNVVWNVMERFLNSNDKVFGSFIGIMTLGIITLLLNR